jgi:glycosyltransferase involved in cell wall biosynthesis
MTESPLVSVCIPTYNRASTIAHAIASAQAQDYRNIEILIFDNHSVDETEEIVRTLARTDERIRHIRQPENVGMTRNFSACIAAARGEFIKFLCDDDALAPDCVSKLKEAFGWSANVVLAVGARRLVDDKFRPLRVAATRRRSELVDGDQMIRECFVSGNRIGEPTAVMFRRSDAGRGFDARYEQAVDLEMWCYLLRKGRLAFRSEVLCSVRQHVGQASRANIRTGRVMEDKRLMFREMAPRFRAKLSWLEKYAWDARMASSAVRARRSGGTVDAEALSEVFHGKTFRHVLLPLAAIAWACARRTDS